MVGIDDTVLALWRAVSMATGDLGAAVAACSRCLFCLGWHRLAPGSERELGDKVGKARGQRGLGSMLGLASASAWPCPEAMGACCSGVACLGLLRGDQGTKWSKVWPN